jgi:hypothetical protein
VVAAAEAADFPGTFATAPVMFSVPVIEPRGAGILEGDAGTTTLVIPVRLSYSWGETVTAEWDTFVVSGSDIEAAPGSDYVAASGTLTWPADTFVANIEVTINGDDVSENDEWLIVTVHDPSHGTIGGFYGLAFGLIVDDDAAPS